MKKILSYSLMLSLTFLAGGCRCYCPTCPSHPATDAPKNQMAVTVNGEVLDFENGKIDAEIMASLKAKENEFAQQIFQMKLMALTAAVENKLLENEAKAKNITVNELEEKEIVAKIAIPTDEEITEFFEKNGLADEDMKLEEVRPNIGNFLMQQRYEEARNKLIAGLKAKAKIKFDIIPPALERFDIPLADGASWGDVKKAKVTIVEFSDFECPFCGKAAKVIDEVVKDYGPEVMRIFRHFPLPMHPHAAMAARAAVCAKNQGKFWEVHHKFFENQHNLDEESLKKYIKEVGMDEAKYNDCMSDEGAMNVVINDMALGDKSNVDGTPTIFINGMRLEGASNPELLKAYIDAELKAAK